MKRLSFDESDELFEAITQVLMTYGDDELDVATLHTVISGLELILSSYEASPQVRALTARLAEARANVQALAPVVSRYAVH